MTSLPLVGQHDQLSAEISGPSSALHALADLISKGERDETIELAANVELLYPFKLGSILVTHAATIRATVSLDGDRLLIEGNADQLESIAASIRFAADETADSHSHMEYYSDHPFLRPDALPLVFRVA